MINTEIISIGNELLSGITINTNSAWISRRLDSIGLNIRWVTTIADLHDDIITALHTASERADIVITTGGLGPTIDDITKNTICEFFDTKLVLHSATLQRVEEIFRNRNIKMARVNRGQAYLPENCTVLPNELGTAPGMMFKYHNTLFFFLPGVPRLRFYVQPEFQNLHFTRCLPRK
jgi:nicotinamide-nucleotide amidase